MKNKAKEPVIKAFPCLDDKQQCDKQCDLCKYVENGLGIVGHQKAGC